ncbi:unnamed protein product [Prunus armeniaca]|uniref:Uncharacterized protein n=1 Tax=Prunus armeniaca TaxID=36596 RepID=A0A6J5Y0J8_PRUAR|nr:unnamed protein product [Prunus armeniaca]
MSLRHCGESSCLGRGVAPHDFSAALIRQGGWARDIYEEEGFQTAGVVRQFVAAHPLPFGKGGFLLLKLGCEGSFGKKSEPLVFVKLWSRLEHNLVKGLSCGNGEARPNLPREAAGPREHPYSVSTASARSLALKP